MRQNYRQLLEAIHSDTVGTTEEDMLPMSDTEMIIRILDYINDKVADLEEHSHTIS